MKVLITGRYCILLVYYWYTIGILLVYSWYTIYYWYTIDILLIYYWYTNGILLICYQYIIGILLVYYWYITIGIFRDKLNREDVNNCLIMIQPTLYSYSFNGPPEVIIIDFYHFYHVFTQI